MLCHHVRNSGLLLSGLRIKENKEVYEGEVTELTPEETENQVGTIPTCSSASKSTQYALKADWTSPTRCCASLQHQIIAISHAFSNACKDIHIDCV